MTIGIYALYWEEQDLTYVGQSQHIEARFSEHLNLMGNGAHTNYKVQNTYNLYGKPTLITLEKCNINMCNELEIYWTKELDSLYGANGLNIIEAGAVGFGPNSNSSKYSKIKILLAFRSLYLSSNNYKTYDILANELGVHKSLLQDIITGASHIWLKTAYSNSYKRMLSNRVKRRKCINVLSHIGCNIPILVSKEGIQVEVINIREFSKLYGLSNSHVCNVINKKRKSHKGWTLK